jgi:hypothetical protein
MITKLSKACENLWGTCLDFRRNQAITCNARPVQLCGGAPNLKPTSPRVQAPGPRRDGYPIFSRLQADGVPQPR